MLCIYLCARFEWTQLRWWWIGSDDDGWLLKKREKSHSTPNERKKMNWHIFREKLVVLIGRCMSVCVYICTKRLQTLKWVTWGYLKNQSLFLNKWFSGGRQFVIEKSLFKRGAFSLNNIYKITKNYEALFGTRIT